MVALIDFEPIYLEGGRVAHLRRLPARDQCGAWCGAARRKWRWWRNTPAKTARLPLCGRCSDSVSKAELERAIARTKAALDG